MNKFTTWTENHVALYHNIRFAGFTVIGVFIAGFAFYLMFVHGMLWAGAGVLFLGLLMIGKVSGLIRTTKRRNPTIAAIRREGYDMGFNDAMDWRVRTGGITSEEAKKAFRDSGNQRMEEL